MNNYGVSEVSEFLGDFIVYRNLNPMDPRLPGLRELRLEAGLPTAGIPRKSQPDYARVIVELLKRARRLDAPAAQIKRLIFIGDTRLNDGTAFENLCKMGGWPGMAFIGSERPAPTQIELAATPGGQPLVLANRWSALADFEAHCRKNDMGIDESTAVVIDLDKTALGARGRNDRVIDQARVAAVKNTVSGLLGADFHPEAFQRAYDTLNQVEYHSFTADNQDYLAYICLVLGSGLFQLEGLLGELKVGELSTFSEFIQRVEAQKIDLSPELTKIHAQIYSAVQQGDPTPFKVFRREEYKATVARMGACPDTVPVEQLLRDEIVITQEVRALALEWRSRGALCFGLSDKPDEASVPLPELAEAGFLPIQRTRTHIVGE